MRRVNDKVNICPMLLSFALVATLPLWAAAQQGQAAEEIEPDDATTQPESGSEADEKQSEIEDSQETEAPSQQDELEEGDTTGEPAAQVTPAGPVEPAPSVELQVSAPSSTEETSPDIAALSSPAEEAPQETDLSFEDRGEERSIGVSALLQNLLLLRNDSDFDPTKEAYDEDGQSVGALATLFKPSILFNIPSFGEIFYDLELGLNIWSKNNPDQADPTADDRFFLKHRELWASGQFFDNWVAFKIGYQHFSDPSGLFLNHWMGVASIGLLPSDEHLWISVGQVPETTYEGFLIDENNFVHDTFFVGVHRVNPVWDFLKIKGSVFALFDNHVVDRRRTIVAPAVGAELTLGPATASIDAVFQFGRSDFAIEDKETTHFAWALEAHGELDLGLLGIALNGLLLSPDDDYDRNDFDGSFFYSGKNRSATVILTEDELRDRSDNLDEKMGTKDGGFYQLRSGLGVVDAKVEGRIGDWFRPALVGGAAFTMAAGNSAGSRYVGTEVDVDLGFVWKDVFAWHIVGGVFFPGEAGGALVNTIDLSQTENQYTLLSSVTVRY